MKSGFFFFLKYFESHRGFLFLCCFSVVSLSGLLMDFKVRLQQRALLLLPNYTSCSKLKQSRYQTTDQSSQDIPQERLLHSQRTRATRFLSITSNTHTHHLNTHMYTKAQQGSHFLSITCKSIDPGALSFLSFVWLFSSIDLDIGVLGTLHHIGLEYHVLGLTICVLLHRSSALPVPILLFNLSA